MRIPLEPALRNREYWTYRWFPSKGCRCQLYLAKLRTGQRTGGRGGGIRVGGCACHLNSRGNNALHVTGDIRSDCRTCRGPCVQVAPRTIA